MSFCNPKHTIDDHPSADLTCYDSEPLSVHLIKKKWSGQKVDDPYKIIVSEFNQINARFEINLMMHKLTAEHYSNRAFWLSFIPLLGVTTLVSICGFIGTGTYDDSVVEGGGGSGGESGWEGEEGGFEFEMPEIANSTLSMIVGLLGVLSTALASLAKHLNYQSKADMHESAVSTLRGILEEMEFERLEVKHKKRMDRSRGFTKEQILENEANLKKMRIQIEKHKSKFDTMEKSCEVPVPNEIKHAFICLDEHVGLIPRKIRFDHYRRYYNDLNRAFHTEETSCLFIPSIDVEKMFKNRIMRDVDALWKNESDKAQAKKKGTHVGDDDSDDDDAVSESGEEKSAGSTNNAYSDAQSDENTPLFGNNTESQHV